MSAETIDSTKYNAMVENAASQVKVSSSIFKAFIGDVKNVVDQHATEIDGKPDAVAIDAYKLNVARTISMGGML